MLNRESRPESPRPPAPTGLVPPPRPWPSAPITVNDGEMVDVQPGMRFQHNGRLVGFRTGSFVRRVNGELFVDGHPLDSEGRLIMSDLLYELANGALIVHRDVTRVHEPPLDMTEDPHAITLGDGRQLYPMGYDARRRQLLDRMNIAQNPHTVYHGDAVRVTPANDYGLIAPDAPPIVGKPNFREQLVGWFGTVRVWVSENGPTAWHAIRERLPIVEIK